MLSRRAVARGAARDLIYPLVVDATLFVLAARKRLLRPSGVRRMEAAGGQRVLVVAAHPDDETIGCAGAIMAHIAAGDRVDILMVTDGRGSRAGGLSPAQMAEQRRTEAERIEHYFGGAVVRQLGLLENSWTEGELLTVLKWQLSAEQYGLLYVPSCVDFHPEHMKVGRVLAHTLTSTQMGDQSLLRVYEMQVPLGVELANRVLPLGKLMSRKAEAISIYRSQRGALDLWKREARYLGGMYGAGRGAEVFWEISPSAYVCIMERGTWGWRDTPFRSLSGRPFGDLRAHLTGTSARRMLRAQVEGAQLSGTYTSPSNTEA